MSKGKGSEFSGLEIFRALMEAKLLKNQDKPVHYSDTPISVLVSRLRQEVQELTDSILNHESTVAVLNEAADVANFAMFIGMNYQRNFLEVMKEATKKS